MSENLADKGASEHFRLIRESSEYRNFLMMEELLAEMQPSLSQEELPNSNNLEYNNKSIIMGEGRGVYYTSYLDRKIRCLNLQLEYIDEFVTMVMPIVERQKIPVKLVEIPMPKKTTIPMFRNAVGIREFLQLKSQLVYLQSKLNEHLDKSKKGKQREW